MNTSQPQLNNLPERDIELLSAYLDNQLSVAERLGLERRLEAEPALRVELAELRATTAVLRELEPLRPPRSFTLDPATAPRRARVFPLAWATQLGSGFAGLALVLLATAQIFFGAAAATSFSEIGSGLGGGSAPAAQAPAAADARQASEPTVAAAAEMQAMATSAPAGAEMASEAAPAADSAEGATAASEEGDVAMMEAPADSPPAMPPVGLGGGAAAGGMGGDPSIDATMAAQEAGSTGSANTGQLPPEAAAKTEAEPADGGVPPGLTMALGVALIALAAGTHLYRRRA